MSVAASGTHASQLCTMIYKLATCASLPGNIHLLTNLLEVLKHLGHEKLFDNSFPICSCLR